jgi:hypothetical protein
VNRSGEQFLAGAARSLNKHRALGFGKVGKNIEEREHTMVLGDNIFKRISAGDLFPEFLNRRKVPKGLDAPDDAAAGIAEDSGADAYRYLFAVSTQNVHRLVDDLLACRKGAFQCALPLADVGPQDLKAILSDGILAGNARDALSRAIEVRNAHCRINGEHAIGDAIENRPGVDTGYGLR